MNAPSGRETIVSLATAPGRGAIGIIRLSGPAALSLLTRVFAPKSASFSGFRPWTLHRGALVDGPQVLDDALAVYMPAPRTFTGEDMAELHCHGSPALLALALERLCALGARQAERGEFTRRAFMNGRMDLSQAEAVAELISAPGPEAVRWAAARLEGHLGGRVRALRERIDALRAGICLAVDFPDEETAHEVDAGMDAAAFRDGVAAGLAEMRDLIAACDRTRPWREGLALALAGPVNAGKSSLFNLLLGRERALVSPDPGTTRDYLEESVRLGGVPARVADTAGLNPASEQSGLEAEGLRLGRKVLDAADMVLLLVDGARPDAALTARLLERFGRERVILIWNKADLGEPAAWFEAPPFALAARLSLSACTGQGLEALEQAVRAKALADAGTEPDAGLIAPNMRQALALRRAEADLAALLEEVAAGLPWDVCGVRLDSVAAALEDVVGVSAPQEVLNRVFSTFCMGK
jgi:tRNA modification GTPase